MTTSKPLGIRPTLWIALGLTVASTALAASALYGYQSWRRAEAAEELRARALAEAYAAQAGTWLARSPGDLGPRVDAVAWHSDVCLLAILKPTTPPTETTTDRALKIRGDVRLIDAFLKAQPEGLGVARVEIARPAAAQQAWPELYVAGVPVRIPGSRDQIATLVCGVRSASRSIFTPREIGIFFARLLIAATAGGILGFWWLRKMVVGPLASLAERSQDGIGPTASHTLHSGRDDEIGSLARTLAEMHISLEEWRERAVRLERNVNHRVASETQRVNRELQQAQKKIWTDELTRLGNRRLLEDQFDKVFAAQREADDELSVVMIDVDNFKQLNDAKGHAAGDEILKFVGELLKQSLREQDLAIRYGGDEFILLLPGVTLRDAHHIAQRTILLFNQQARLLSVEPKPSMSAGIASLWEHKPSSADELKKLADEALYAAKRAGKGRANIAIRCVSNSSAGTPRPKSRGLQPAR